MKQEESEKSAGLLPLHVDIVFKIFCINNPKLLMNLLNAVLGFEKEEKIKEIKILNPEIPGDFHDEKISILDIHAVNEKKEHFNVEMQTSSQSFYGKRILYYWARLYTTQIDKGEEYGDLKPVYSISFLNFQMKQTRNFHSSFRLLEKDSPEIHLTKDLEIHIIELPRFKGNLETLETELENWVYLLREAGQLKEREMSDLKIKNPVIREAVEALQDISLDNKTRNYYEMRLKAARDYEAMKDYAYKEGRKSGFEAGIEKGIEKGREQERLLAQEEIEKTQRLASIREKRAEHKKALRTAINLKKEGAELKFISRITELPEAYLERFFRKAFGD